jgi:hypothetical protein
MEKKNIRENSFFCVNCLHSFSFLRGEIEAKEVRKISKRAGNSRERVKRFREKKPPTGSLKVV